ncbi:hypothetical protein D3C87_2000430 [compost metagenome]
MVFRKTGVDIDAQKTILGLGIVAILRADGYGGDHRRLFGNRTIQLHRPVPLDKQYALVGKYCQF